MALITVIEAAVLVGKSTQTLYRHAKAGKLSKDGEGKVDTAELLRVYGAFKSIKDSHSVPQIKTVSLHEQTNTEAALLRKVEKLEAKLESQRVEFLQRENRIMTMLEHKQDSDTRIEKLEERDERMIEVLKQRDERMIEVLERIETPSVLSFIRNAIKPKT